MRVSEIRVKQIRVKQIRVNQGLVLDFSRSNGYITRLDLLKLEMILCVIKNV